LEVVMFRGFLVGSGIAASLLLLAFISRQGRLAAHTASALAAQVPPEEGSADPEYEGIDQYIERQLSRLNVPGAALAIVEHDQIVHQQGFGEARPRGTAPSPQTPFFVGSITKSFTALALMQLVEAGKVDLDAPIQRYLPWFRVADPQASTQISARHLLNQTSALPTGPGWEAMADSDPSPGAGERQARALATLELTRPVGSAFEYSNTNFDLLGLMIEAVSGESYEGYIQHHIFAPLEMRHSYTARDEAAKAGLAQGHRYWFAHPVATDLPVPRGSLPSGQLISSAEDMAHYLIAHLNGGRYRDAQVLSAAGIAEMHRPAVEAKQGTIQGQYGMGWHVKDVGTTRTIWHDGSVPDFLAYMAILPDHKKAFVLFLNADHLAMVVALDEIGPGVVRLLRGDEPAGAQFGFIPWALRGLLLIPVLQIVGVAVTLWFVRRWRRDPNSRPSSGRKWLLHVSLPLVPNLLLAAAPILLLRSGITNFLFLFAPDVSWIALICGSFAAVWMFVRTGLVLWTLQRRAEPFSSLAQGRRVAAITR
jgi:CubicO group peptidase (beta-lactamase class C family)